MEEIKNKILEEYKNGNIVFASFECLHSANLKDFIKQPLLGLLYDLNRDEATILTLIEDPKWVNDFAVCKVISELKEQNEKLLHAISELKSCALEWFHNRELVANCIELANKATE